MNLRTHPDILAIEKKYQDKGLDFKSAYQKVLFDLPQGAIAASDTLLLDIIKRALMEYLIANAPSLLDKFFSWIGKKLKRNAKQQDNG